MVKLQDNEKVIIASKLSFSALGKCVALVASAVLIMVLAILFEAYVVWLVTSIVIAAFSAVILVLLIRQYLISYIVVTDKKVYSRYGLLKVTKSQLEFADIINVTVWKYEKPKKTLKSQFGDEQEKKDTFGTVIIDTEDDCVYLPNFLEADKIEKLLLELTNATNNAFNGGVEAVTEEKVESKEESTEV